jgi:hypothetical protein
MNISSRDHFRKEINQVREYIKHIQCVNDLAGYVALETDSEQIKTLLNSLKGHDNSFRINKKVFEYKAIIISLYGLLEKFIEIWIKEYLEQLSNIVPEYTQIDEKIREKHFELSLKLISTITSRESAKYQHLTKEQVLRKLNHCIENPSDYQFNTEAFVLLSGNLKHNKIVELFKPLNIDLNGRLKINQTLVEYIQYERQIENIAHLETAVLYEPINHLVDRRNEIAHGSEMIENILDHSVLEDYLQFLEQYCQAIFEILTEELIKQESFHHFQEIKNVIKIFNNEILAFEIENDELKVGESLIIETAEGRFFKKTILDIRIDDRSYSQKTFKNKTVVTIRVEAKIQRNQKFFLCRKP